MCTEFVDEYVDPIIQALAQMSPEMVCQELGLCKANEIKVRDLVKVKPIKASPQCELCEMIVKELDSLLSENSTQEEIEQALEQVCGLLPSAYKDECDNFVKQYEPAIVQILVNEISPDVICTALQLCGSSRFMKEEMMPSNGNITICSMCETLLGIAKKLVEDNETEADLEKALRLICWYMLPVKQQCDDFINKTIPLIFNELKKLDPDTICKQLKLCPSDFYPNDVRCYLKGRNQCEDPELAKKCGANCLI
ncbi:prosaposin-like [Exaiptasia diaphana]|uniref:Pulmonary surfactant-associated protein B n=1 Tax=Exaiptasia diaphana TaxID=2652724 RepID=A0A913WTI0_EXADI|nr:prosaposin-like [Exaiptasia diaphana]